jgi:hypothetical protein
MQQSIVIWIIDIVAIEQLDGECRVGRKLHS